jgi:hypothetical protein
MSSYLILYLDFLLVILPYFTIDTYIVNNNAFVDEESEQEPEDQEFELFDEDCEGKS